MKKSLILNALGFIMSSSLLSACSTQQQIKPVTSVEVRTIEIPRPAPIVPNVDQLDLKPVHWVVLTPDNIDQKFGEIYNGDMVFFALTKEGYENLTLNLSDIRANVEQYKKIVAIYKSQF